MSNDTETDLDRGFQAWIPVLKQWRIGCLVALSLFLGACVVLAFIQPFYRSYIQLLLPSKQTDDPADRKSTTQTQADAYVVRSYADIIKDDGIARKVIDDLRLIDSAEFKFRPTWQSRSIKYIRGLISSDETGGTSLFSANEVASDGVLQDYEGRLNAVSESKALTILLSFQAHDPHLAQAIVTAHAEAFVQDEIDFRRRDAAAKVAWIKKELDRTATEARDAQVALQLNPTTNAFSRDISANAVSALKMRQLQATATQTVYEAVLKRYQDMLADQSYEGSGIRILSAATTPTNPYFPKKLLSAAVAAVICAILGFLASAIAALMRKKVDVAALVSSCDLPVLGHINVPGLDYGQRGRLRRSLFWHQIHEIRSSISITEKRHPVVMVTSAVPKEGKSLLASALARDLASSGVRTVLIDLHGRNARYGASLDARQRATSGLQDFLEGAEAAKAAVKIDAATPLFLITANTNKPTDVSVHSAVKLRSRFTTLKKEFEAIVIDTPAMEYLSDAVQISGLADEIILTALSDHPRAGKVKADIARLRSRSVHLKGVVIVDESSPSSADLARLSGYSVRHQLFEIWPKAPRHQTTFAAFLQRITGRKGFDSIQAKVSV